MLGPDTVAREIKGDNGHAVCIVTCGDQKCELSTADFQTFKSSFYRYKKVKWALTRWTGGFEESISHCDDQTSGKINLEEERLVLDHCSQGEEHRARAPVLV